MMQVSSRPLFVIADASLLDQLLQLAASVGVEPQLVPDLGAARAVWSQAPLIVLDAIAAQESTRLQLPRRGSVVLLSGQYVSGREAVTVSPSRQASSEDAESTEIWRLASAIDADHVVELPAGSAWLAERLSNATHGPQSTVVGVVGGRGGAGASVLASALAITAAHAGHRTLLLDADPLGGGLDLLLGRESYDGARWPDLIAAPSGGVDGEIYDALPKLGELSLLSWDRGEQLHLAPQTLRKVLTVGCRGSDLVVVDLPRMPDDAARVALDAADVVLVVVPAEVRSVAAAARVVATIRPHCQQLQVVVRIPAPAGLKAAEVAAALRLPLLGTLRCESSLATSVEKGIAPGSTHRGSLAQLSVSILDQLLTQHGRVSA
jgi:secretion/DNA translocation related CpaE-like protein